MRPRPLAVFASSAVVVLAACAPGTPAYPPRPPATPGAPVADPAPTKLVMHTTVTRAALTATLDETLPKTGTGTFPLLGKERTYTWKREALALSFAQGRIGVATKIHVVADMPVSSLEFPLDVRVMAEPVVTSDYLARLQSVEVAVSSTDTRVKVAEGVAGVLEKLRLLVQEKLGEFSHDLRPMVEEAYARVAQPVDLPLGDARGCAELRVLGVEAGPTVLADGIEKDLALIVAPSVTLPCASSGPPPPLPPLANVANLTSGPFSITVPVAARYEELAKAMSLAFTDGRYYFSKEYPGLYMENPEVYAGADQLVLKLHIKGPIHKLGGEHELDGDLFLAGHPTVVDNEIRIPDLEPTIETKSFLLKLKALKDGDEIRDQARQALRLDIGARLQQVRAKLSTDLAFGDGRGCLRAEAHKVEVTGVHAHATYLRVYVGTTARASLYLPCPG